MRPISWRSSSSDSAFNLVASPSYLAARGEPTRIAELREHDCILFGSSTEATWRLANAGALEVRGRFAANHLLSVRDAAVAGFGIAMLPTVVIAPAIGSGALRPILPDACPPAVPIWVTYAGGRHISPAVRAFVDFAKAAFAPTLEKDSRV